MLEAVGKCRCRCVPSLLALEKDGPVGSKQDCSLIAELGFGVTEPEVAVGRLLRPWPL